MTALVLMGGTSDERDVSLASGRAVCAALAQGAGCPEQAAPLPHSVLPVELEPDGTWTAAGGRSGSAEEILAGCPGRTIVFLALHGAGGEDGALQGFLETVQRPYTGSGVESSALCMNKHLTRLLARELGLAVAPGKCLAAADWRSGGPDGRARLLASLEELGPELFIKPLRGGSSVGASAAGDGRGLGQRLETVFATGDDALVENAVSGIEATCAVLETADGGARVLPPVEILPARGRFFDYQQKYSADGARELCPTENLTAAARRAVMDGALALHRAAACRGATRTDFIVPLLPGGGQGQPVLLEINTLPGLTERSILPRAARVAGLSFRDLCLELLALARPESWQT